MYFYMALYVFFSVFVLSFFGNLFSLRVCGCVCNMDIEWCVCVRSIVIHHINTKQLTTMFANIVQRQTIQSELQVILPHILSVYREELLLIESIVSEVLLAFEYRGVDAIVPLEHNNFPPMAGAMMWLENYQRRCDVFAASEVKSLIKVLM